MDHIRCLAVFVDEPTPGRFHWSMIESATNAGPWIDIAHGHMTYDTWIEAFDLGMVELHRLVIDERIGPRARAEDEDSDPVG